MFVCMCMGVGVCVCVCVCVCVHMYVLDQDYQTGNIRLPILEVLEKLSSNRVIDSKIKLSVYHISDI
jgi:hypothetical protein